MHSYRSRSSASSARVVTKNRRKRYLDIHPEYYSSPFLELADPLAYDRFVRRFQTSAEREAEGRKKGFSGVLEADLLRSEAKIDALQQPDHIASTRYKREEDGRVVAEERDEEPLSKEEGMQRWRQEMEMRFVNGEDGDFDYGKVDGHEEYDDHRTMEREEEERWFDEQEPQWTNVGKETGGDDSALLVGQTGVQDY